MVTNQSRPIFAGTVLIGLLLTAGCYESKYTLGNPDDAKVDPAYVGDYTATNSDNKTATIVIRNIDGKQYYVEWTENKDKPARITGFTADVKGATFANLRGMTEDGSLDDKYTLMRISLSADKSTLTIRNLNDQFFKDKSIDSAAALKGIIEQNLENQAMYDPDSIVAIRVPAAKKS